MTSPRLSTSDHRVLDLAKELSNTWERRMLALLEKLKALKSPWLLQLLMSDDPKTVNMVMATMEKILRCDGGATPDLLHTQSHPGSSRRSPSISSPQGTISVKPP